MTNKPELLCPAGNWASLTAAIENGADAVYFGVKGINMRQFAGNFEISELKKIMETLKGANKKGYLTLNTIIMNGELDKVRQILTEAGVSFDIKSDEVTEDDLQSIRRVIDEKFKVEGDLRREILGNVKRLMDLGCYRGLRHRKGPPVRGQRTKTNARTRTGPRRR